MSSPQSMSVDQVAVAFYSLATSLFLLDANSFSGSLDEKFRDEDRSYIWLWSFPVKMRELYDGIFSKRAPHFEHLPDFCCMTWLPIGWHASRLLQGNTHMMYFLLTAVLLRWFLLYSRLELVVMIQMLRDCLLFACWRLMGCFRWLEISVVVVDLKILAKINSSRLFLGSPSLLHLDLIKQDKGAPTSLSTR
ncbi:uncharacterized protein [Primulina eburnea]